MLQVGKTKMAVFAATLLFISFETTVSSGIKFYAVEKKQIVADQKFIKRLLLKFHPQECLGECLYTSDCQSFNVIRNITKNLIVCDLYKVNNGTMKDSVYSTHFSRSTYQTTSNNTIEILSLKEDKFTIRKDNGCASVHSDFILIFEYSPPHCLVFQIYSTSADVPILKKLDENIFLCKIDGQLQWCPGDLITQEKLIIPEITDNNSIKLVDSSNECVKLEVDSKAQFKNCATNGKYIMRRLS